LSIRAGKDTQTWPSVWFCGARRFGRYDAIALRRSEKPGKNSKLKLIESSALIPKEC